MALHGVVLTKYFIRCVSRSESERVLTKCHPYHRDAKAEHELYDLPAALVRTRAVDATDRRDLREVDANAHARSRKCHPSADNKPSGYRRAVVSDAYRTTLLVTH